MLSRQLDDLLMSRLVEESRALSSRILLRVPSVDHGRFVLPVFDASRGSTVEGDGHNAIFGNLVISGPTTRWAQKPVISRVKKTPLIGVKSPQLPIYFRPFIGVSLTPFFFRSARGPPSIFVVFFFPVT